MRRKHTPIRAHVDRQGSSLDGFVFCLAPEGRGQRRSSGRESQTLQDFSRRVGRANGRENSHTVPAPIALQNIQREHDRPASHGFSRDSGSDGFGSLPRQSRPRRFSKPEDEMRDREEFLSVPSLKTSHSKPIPIVDLPLHESTRLEILRGGFGNSEQFLNVYVSAQKAVVIVFPHESWFSRPRQF